MIFFPFVIFRSRRQKSSDEFDSVHLNPPENKYFSWNSKNGSSLSSDFSFAPREFKYILYILLVLIANISPSVWREPTNVFIHSSRL